MLGKAILQKVSEFDETDFALESEAYEHLLDATGTSVEVLCEATDGYYDIRLSDGTTYDAISGYHLRGYDQPERVVHGASGPLSRIDSEEE